MAQDLPHKPEEDSGRGLVGHERAARESAKKESWMRQFCRAIGLSKGRPERSSDRPPGK